MNMVGHWTSVSASMPVLLSKPYSHFMFSCHFQPSTSSKKCIAPEKRNSLLDGTFKIVPKPSKLFNQLLIISIEYKNDVSLNNLIISEIYFFYFSFAFFIRKLSNELNVSLSRNIFRRIRIKKIIGIYCFVRLTDI